MAGARKHPKYSGSNAHRFMHCAGQVAFCANIPDEETEHTIDGTFAHLVLEAAITNRVDDVSAMVAAVQINGRWVDEETAEAVQHVVDYVNALRLQYPDLMVNAEREMLFLGIEAPRFDSGGTMDIWAYSACARHAWIIDYKHGAGERVDVDDNAQLLFYLSVFVGNLYTDHYTGVIIQPRHWAYTRPREQNFSWVQLFDFALDVHDAICAAEQPGAKLTPGTWCNRCKGAATCPALNNKVQEVLLSPVTLRTVEMIDLDHVDLVRIGEITTLAPMIRSFLKAVEERAFRFALQGKQVPGNKLVKAQARRKWRPDMTPEAIVAAAQRLGVVDEIRPRKLLALTVVEGKLVAAARARADPGTEDQAAAEARRAFAFLTLRDTSGVVSLVPESDPRPAYTGSAADDFAGVTIEHVA